MKEPAYAHLSDAEIAKEIRERVAELNDLTREAAGRDIVITYEHRNAYYITDASNPKLIVTTTQRI